MDAATALCERLEDNRDAKYVMDAERAGGDCAWPPLNWDHAFPAVDELEQALDDELLNKLDIACIGDLAEALHYTKEALPEPGQLGGDMRILAEAVDVLYDGAAELHEYCYHQAIAAFGLWGAYWFVIAAKGQFDLASIGGAQIGDVSSEAVLYRMRTPEQTDSERESENATEDRDLWIYEQVMSGRKYEGIWRELRTKPLSWSRYSDWRGVKAAARRYATQHNLPLPQPRNPGRPPGS